MTDVKMIEGEQMRLDPDNPVALWLLCQEWYAMNPSLCEPDEVRGRCLDFSMEFLEFLVHMGYPGIVPDAEYGWARCHLLAFDMTDRDGGHGWDPLPDEYALEDFDDDIGTIEHHVSCVDGWAIDWTARQFDPSHSVPLITRVR